MSAESIDASLLAQPIEVVVKRGDRVVIHQIIRHSPVRIGRILENDIVLPFDGVSRHHCELRFDFENSKWTLIDLKSLNGIKVDGQNVQSASFDQLGEFELKPFTVQFRPAAIDAAPEVLPEVQTVAPPNATKDSPPSLSPSREDQISQSRSPVLDLHCLDVLTGIHPLAESARRRSVQVSVIWQDIVLSTDEFCNGETIRISLNGVDLNLGYVHGDRAKIRCPKGIRFADRPGKESTLLVNSPASWALGDGVEIHARFVPQSKVMPTSLLPRISDELVDPVVLSGAVHGAAALAALTLSRTPNTLKPENTDIQPERIARIIEIAKVQPTPTPPPTPRPSPTATPPQDVAEKPQPTPKPMSVATPAISPTPTQKLQIAKPKPTPTKIALGAKPRHKSTSSLPAPKQKVIAVEPTATPTKTVTVTATPTPAPAPSPSPTPTPKPFQAKSVGALKTLSMLDTILPKKVDDGRETSNPKAETTAPSTEPKTTPATSPSKINTSELMRRLPSAQQKGSAADQLEVGIGSGTKGYEDSGYNAKTGRRGVAGSVLGGANLSDSKNLKTSAGLTRDQVTTVIRAHQSEIQICVEKSRKKLPKLGQDAEFNLLISPSGKVESVSATSSSLKVPEPVIKCVSELLMKLQFPSASDGESTSQTIGLPLRPL